MLNLFLLFVYTLSFLIAGSAFARVSVHSSFATDGEATATSVFFQQEFIPTKYEQFHLGYIIRSSYFKSSKNLIFTDSSASFVKVSNSVKIKSPEIVSTNLGIVANYNIIPILGLGLNLDLLGFSFGSKKELVDFSIRSSPTPFNVFLVNTNDIGSLNSEFYIFYLHNDFLSIRTGLTHFFAEYTTDQKINDQNRYRRIMNMFFISLGVVF